MRNRTTPELCKGRHAFAEGSLALKFRPKTAMAIGCEIGKNCSNSKEERKATAVTDGVQEVGDKKQRDISGLGEVASKGWEEEIKVFPPIDNPRSSRGEDVESLWLKFKIGLAMERGEASSIFKTIYLFDQERVGPDEGGVWQNIQRILERRTFSSQNDFSPLV